MATTSGIRQDVRALLAEGAEFRYRPDLPDDASLLDRGVTDSFEMITLVVRLEERFHVHFDPDELTRENLESIASIAGLLGTKLGASPE